MREGSVKVRIEGRGMERFFNIAAQRGIMIEKIETKEIPAAEHDRHDNRVEKNELENEERKRKWKKRYTFGRRRADFKRLKADRPENGCPSCESQRNTVFHSGYLLGRRRSLWVGGLAAFFLLICRLILLCVGHLL